MRTSAYKHTQVHMANRRITVLLSEEEYTQVRISAGLVPMSRWIKNVALNGAEPRRVERDQAKFADSDTSNPKSRNAGNSNPAVGEVATVSAEVPTAPNQNGKTEDHRAEDMPMVEEVPMVKRSARRSARVSTPIEPCNHGADPRFCKHEECRR